MADQVHFALVTGGFTGQYQMRVTHAEHGEYRAKLISVGIGTIMEPAGRTPAEAVRNLVSELEAAGGYDRKIGKEIRKYTQWAFR